MRERQRTEWIFQKILDDTTKPRAFQHLCLQTFHVCLRHPGTLTGLQACGLVVSIDSGLLFTSDSTWIDGVVDFSTFFDNEHKCHLRYSQNAGQVFGERPTHKRMAKICGSLQSLRGTTSDKEFNTRVCMYLTHPAIHGSPS